MERLHDKNPVWFWFFLSAVARTMNLIEWRTKNWTRFAAALKTLCFQNIKFLCYFILQKVEE